MSQHAIQVNERALPEAERLKHEGHEEHEEKTGF